MAIKKVYKSGQANMTFITRSGKSIVFFDHRHITDDEKDIGELDEEIKSRNPYIYVDPEEKEIDTTLQDKIKAAQLEATRKVLAEEAKAGYQAKAAATVQQASTMSAATLQGMATSATLSSLSAPSVSK